MSSDEDRAVETLTRMFQTLYRAVGLVWTDDNAADVEDVVSSICRASGSEAI